MQARWGRTAGSVIVGVLLTTLSLSLASGAEASVIATGYGTAYVNAPGAHCFQSQARPSDSNIQVFGPVVYARNNTTGVRDYQYVWFRSWLVNAYGQYVGGPTAWSPRATAYDDAPATWSGYQVLYFDGSLPGYNRNLWYTARVEISWYNPYSGRYYSGLLQVDKYTYSGSYGVPYSVVGTTC